MLLISIVTTFVITFITLIALRPLAKKVGLVDIPGGRKTHVGEVPIVGGMAMYLGLLVGLTVVPVQQSSLLYLIAAGGLLVAIGTIDDRFGMPTSARLAAHFVAVLIMVFGAGLSVQNIGDPFGFGEVFLGKATLIATVLITISVINAFNFIDGVDGLAGTMAAIALVAVALVGPVHWPIMSAALMMIAAAAAFLILNFPHSGNRHLLTFMGDAGSTLLGLVIVWVTASVCQGPEAVASPVICLWFVAVPVYDFFSCLVNRALHGHSPFRPGRDHFHHILQGSGMGSRSVLAVLATLQAVYAFIGLFGHFAGIPDVVMFAAWSIIGISQHRIIRRIATASRLNIRSRRGRAV